MSKRIIAGMRAQKHLKGNTFLAAVELAHHMNDQGFVRMSYDFLAWKVRCCRKTAITQVAKLVQLGLLRKTIHRTSLGYSRNLYQYLGHIPRTSFPPVTTHSVKGKPILPENKKEKEISLHEELENQRKGLRLGLYTPGSDLWHKTCEEIARLEGLLVMRAAVV